MDRQHATLTTITESACSSGRLTLDSVSAGSGVDSTVAALGYGYNDAGQMSTGASYNSTGGSLNQVAMTYDGFGNLITDAQSNSGNVSGGTPTVSYTYDASNGDRLTGITYPDGRTINYNYASENKTGTQLVLQDRL
jgi:YD repeat-containing protein